MICLCLSSPLTVNVCYMEVVRRVVGVVVVDTRSVSVVRLFRVLSLDVVFTS